MRYLLSELSMDQMEEWGDMLESLSLWDHLPFAPDRKMSADSLNSERQLITPSNSGFFPLRSCHVLTGDGVKDFAIPKRGPSLMFSKPGWWRTERGDTEMIWDHNRWNSRSNSETSLKGSTDKINQSDYMSSDSESPSDNEGKLFHSAKSTNLVNLVDRDTDVETDSSDPFVDELLAYSIDTPKNPRKTAHSARLYQALQKVAKETDYSGDDGKIWMYYHCSKVAHCPHAPPATRSATPLFDDHNHPHFTRGSEWMTRPERISQMSIQQYRAVCHFMHERDNIRVRRDAIRARRPSETAFLGGPDPEGEAEGSELRAGWFRMTQVHDGEATDVSERHGANGRGR